MPGATLVYDDDCGFCTWWANWIEARSDLRLVGFSALEGDGSGGPDDPADLRSRLPENYESCSHLVTDDDVYSCGASIEEAIARSEVCRGLDLSGLVGFLRHFRDYNRARESGYRWVADHRGLLGRVLSADSVSREGESGE